MGKTTQTECFASTGTKNKCPGLALSLTQTRLRVKDVMNQDVITARPGETIFSAAKRMCTHHVSCVVVVDENAVMGVFTQKDLLRGIAQEQEGYCQLPVAERMSSPTVVASPDLPVLEAGRILKSKQIKHLPVAAEQRLVGIVTQTDITRGLIYLTPLQRVSEVMSPNIATVGLEATVADAARSMWSHNISCVVVMQQNEAVGIITQNDIVTRVISLQKNPTRTPVVDVMSSPILPIPPNYSVFTASRMMHQMHIHRFVVQDEERVCGIVSQTDILQAVERRLGEEEKHRLFLVCSEIPMFMLDAKWTVTYVNAAFLRLFDFEAYEDIVGSSFSDDSLWNAPKDRQRVLDVLDQGEPNLLGLAVKTSAGRRKRVVLLLTVSKNASDEISGWQGVIWDVSGRRPPKKKLRHALHSSAPASTLWDV
jgi:CBS domain-containing protein